jgi:hypothetical protein
MPQRLRPTCDCAQAQDCEEEIEPGEARQHRKRARGFVERQPACGLPKQHGLGYVVDAKAAIALVDPAYRVIAVIAPS